MMTHKTTTSTAKFARALSYSVAVAAIVSLLPNPSRAAPVGGVVASGSASISASGLETTINQTSDRAVIDWQSFNLSHNETARFVVPSDSSATLNRISGGVSTISGSVESNGTVYFANPNGLVFDATSRVTANGFVATTGTIPNFDFMNRGEFAGHNANQVTLNGAILASAITVQSGTVTVGGNLAAGSGKILLSSSSLTTIGQGATIRADGGAAGNGGNIKIWSDNHTDFLGAITALGGTNSGDGGFVEVSGKATLNFAGTVSTLAAHGKTGTLLLDPATIEIVTAVPATPTTGVSYILTSTLVTALGINNVTIDANTPSTTGFATPPTLLAGGTGLITVIDPVVASGTFNLTLTGSQIIINDTLTVGGILTLVATKASVWQNPGKVITATTLTGSAVDGFALGGANLITNLGAVTNSGTAGILVKNNQNLTITASTIDGGRGGVMILAPSREVTISGAVTVLGSYLRLDMGSTGHLVSPSGASNTLTASGLDVYYTSATASSNNATIAVGSGSFTFVNDKRTVTTAKILNNSSTATDWGAAPTYGNSGGNPTLGGLTITGTGTLNGLGVVYGSTVNIQGIDTGAAKDLRYIEGVGVGVTTAASTFSGSLTLMSSGTFTVNFFSAAIFVRVNLTTTNGGNLNLIHSGDTSGISIYLNGAVRTETTVAGNMTMSQFGSAASGSISMEFTNLVVKGNIVATQAGKVVYTSILIGGSSSITAQAMSLIHSGSAENGIYISASSIFTRKDIALTQTGRVTTAGIILNGTGSISLGSSANQLTITTNSQELRLSDHSDFTIAGGGRVMIDLGSSILRSFQNPGVAVAVYTLNAPGSVVYFKGASSGNNANIAVGSGSFTYIADRSSLTGTVPISNGSTLNDLSLFGVGYGGTTPGTRTIAGLTITGASDTAISGIGVKYGGAVTINGVTPGSVAGSLRYIEANSIQTLTAASNFSGSLILVTSGGTAGYGVKFDTNLTVGTVNDRVSNLTILQYNPIEYDGILISSSIVVTAGGSITMVQAGASNNLNGIATRGQSSIAAGGDLSLTSTGTSFQGSMVLFNTTLDANGDITLTQAATANTVQSGISLSNVKLAARGNISLNQLGNTGTGLGIGMSASSTALPDRVELNAGVGKSISLSAKNGIALNTANNFKLTGASRVVVNLGTSVITSSSGTLTLNAAGMDVLYSGPLSGNNATIAVGGGSFTFVSDQSTVTDSTTIGASTTLATLGLGGVSYGTTPNARTLAGLTITGSSDVLIQGLGVRYGGVVIIEGITTAGASPSPARNLRYIEGTGIGVVNSASSFTRHLTLVSNGSGYGNYLTTTGSVDGIAIGASLTLGTTNDGVSHLTLIMSNTVSGRGILVAEGATVTAGGDINMSMTGTTGTSGIMIRENLIAGGAMNLTHSGASGGNGFYLLGSGTSPTERRLSSRGNMTLTLTASS